MSHNVGTLDRAIRIGIAVIIGVLIYTRTVTGIFGMIISVAAMLLILTSIRRFCLLYHLLGINTCKEGDGN